MFLSKLWSKEIIKQYAKDLFLVDDTDEPMNFVCGALTTEEHAHLHALCRIAKVRLRGSRMLVGGTYISVYGPYGVKTYETPDFKATFEWFEKIIRVAGGATE